jgi:SAM-dependent methyltransferase
MPDDRLVLRTRFDEDALLYDRARPTYPAAVFDAIFDRLPDAARAEPRVLEIGCGTGQATRPLAQRGGEVLAVYLGADMAEVARRNLAPFANVEVINADIEQWNPRTTNFDLIVSATAFHWLEPATRFARVARLLRPGGVLALIQTIHIEGRSESFFADAQRCYERWDPNTPPGLRRPRLQDLPDTSEYGIEHADEFGHATVQWFAVDFRYTAEQYLDLLRTFFNHRALPAADLKGLLACLRRRIESEPDHVITKSVAFELSCALTRSGSTSSAHPHLTRASKQRPARGR